MKPFENFKSRVVVFTRPNVDTDQIIPARFLKTTGKEGLGDKLFHDWRYNREGNPIFEFVLNSPATKEAKILLAGENFGCGSSREHAPWALIQFGFKAIISTSFADIFRQNALKNALLPIVVSTSDHVRIVEMVTQDPKMIVEVDLEKQKLTLSQKEYVEFPIDPFSKYCLTQGIDEIQYILEKEDRIREFEKSHRLLIDTRRSNN